VRALVVIMMFLLVAVAFLPDSKLPDNRASDGKYCNDAWKDSGYKWRLRPYKRYLNSEEIGYICQVNVNGRWVDEEHVKVG
jgi:hypothetical protein